MNDKDKLVSEILDELKDQGAPKESTPLYEQIIRVITKFDRATVPAEVSENLRRRLRRKTQVVSIFKVMSKAAVAFIAFAFLVGIAVFNFPITPANAEKVFISAEDKAIVKDFNGIEFIAEKNTKITKNDDLLNLEKGEVIIYSYNNCDDLNVLMQKMNIKVKPNSVAYFQNGGAFSQIAILKGNAEVKVGEKLQNMNAENGNQLLYQEPDNFDQPIQGSLEKFAKIKNDVLQRTNIGGGSNSQNWANSNIARNITIDRFIMDAKKGEAYLVKRVNVEKDSKSCTVVFNIDNTEKKYEIKNGAPVGSWIVTNVSDVGFELTNGENKVKFKYMN